MIDLSTNQDYGKYVQIMGLDPGFASLGWTIFRVHQDGRAHLVDGGVLHTRKADKKTNTLATDDNLKRMIELATHLHEIAAKGNVRLIAAESMSFPRSSSVAAKVAMCWGALAMLTVVRDPLPILQATPQQVKLAAVGRKDASKKDVEEVMVAKYPLLGIMLDKLKKDDREHLADAAAAVHAALPSTEVRMLRSMMS